MSRASVLVCLDAIASWTRYGRLRQVSPLGMARRCWWPAMLGLASHVWYASSPPAGAGRLGRPAGKLLRAGPALPYGPVAELLRNTLGSEPPPAVVEQLGPRAVDRRTGVLPELTRFLPADREPVRTDPEQDRWRLFQRG